MEIYWLRHGTREFTTGDVPLNDEGKKQAQQLAQLRDFAKLDKILCSPKKRAQMTIEPLATKYNYDIQLHQDLDQMNRHESNAEFTSRVQATLERAEKGEWGQRVLLCTHSDWLSIAAQVVPTNELDFKYKMFQCAEHLRFVVEDGLWKLTSAL